MHTHICICVCLSGLSFSSPGYLPHPELKPGSPTLKADSLPSGPAGKPHIYILLV